MSTKSPQYIVKLSSKPSFIRRYGGVFLVVLSLFFSMFIYYTYAISTDSPKSTGNLQQNKQLQTEMEGLKTTVSQLQTENKVKSEAIKVLQQSLLDSEQKQHKLQAEINFFESLLSNNDNKKGLRVFKVEAKKEKDLTVLSLVLAKKITKAKEKSGTIDLKLKGIVGEKGKTINLTKNFTLNRQFKFKYFQILNFSIKLPEDFNPTVLLVNLYSKSNTPKNISQQFNWHNILQTIEE